jgi:hypothetical protein
MRSTSIIHPTKSSGALRTSQFASTQPPSVLITYGITDATSVNLAFLAQVEFKKSRDAPESNKMIIGHSLRKNVSAKTSSPVGISSMVV